MAGAATVVPKSKTPDIDVLTKPKDLSTIKGEAVDHLGTAKPKVELDVPEMKDVHDVEAPKYSTQELDAYFRKSQQSFTNAEAEGVRVFTSNDYTYINNYLRGFSDDLGPVSTSTISDIDSELSKMELPADLTLYRVTDSASFMNIIDKNFNGTLD